jgi:hypothetical protein
MMGMVDLTDHLGFGMEKRRALNLEVLAGRMTFRCACHMLFCNPSGLG